MAVSSTFELNDTLQITREQGFPAELHLEQYLSTPYMLSAALHEKVFSFTNKSGLRNFVVPPVRCFLVENRNGKRIYRGHCHILSTQLDYEQRSTSGTFRITKLFTPVEMEQAYQIVDGNEGTNYFV